MDFIVILIIAAILFFAIRHLINQKKNGGGCHGCASSKSCSMAQKQSCPSNEN